MAEHREYPCQVVRVVDGDTIHVMVDHGFHISTKQVIRVAGVNCPELSTAEGRQVKEDVLQWVGNNAAFTLRSFPRSDKYGRRVADLIRYDGENLADWLLATGRAAPYNA